MVLRNHDCVFPVSEKINGRFLGLCYQLFGLCLAFCLFRLGYEVRGLAVYAVLELLAIAGGCKS